MNIILFFVVGVTLMAGFVSAFLSNHRIQKNIFEKRLSVILRHYRYSIGN